MPLRPSVQAPRRSLCSTVSAWSSRVWAVATASSQAVRHQLAEEGVAEVAGSLLQGLMQRRGGGRCVCAMEVKCQVMGCGQPANKCRVFRGSLADAVMYVDHGKYDAELVALLEQAPQQGHGVGTAGDRDGDPLTGMEEIVAENWRSRLHGFAYVRASTESRSLDRISYRAYGAVEGHASF